MAISQATIIGKPQPKSWDEFEQGCLATFGGGYRTKEEIEIFHHGISTVFNLLRKEFPSAEQCKASTDFLDACEQALDQLEWYQKQHAGDDQYAARIELLREVIAKAEGKDVLNPRA